MEFVPPRENLVSPRELHNWLDPSPKSLRTHSSSSSSAEEKLIENGSESTDGRSIVKKLRQFCKELELVQAGGFLTNRVSAVKIISAKGDRLLDQFKFDGSLHGDDEDGSDKETGEADVACDGEEKPEQMEDEESQGDYDFWDDEDMLDFKASDWRMRTLELVRKFNTMEEWETMQTIFRRCAKHESRMETELEKLAVTDLKLEAEMVTFENEKNMLIKDLDSSEVLVLTTLNKFLTSLQKHIDEKEKQIEESIRAKKRKGFDFSKFKSYSRFTRNLRTDSNESREGMEGICDDEDYDAPHTVTTLLSRISTQQNEIAMKKAENVMSEQRIKISQSATALVDQMLKNAELGNFNPITDAPQEAQDHLGSLVKSKFQGGGGHGRIKVGGRRGSLIEHFREGVRLSRSLIIPPSEALEVQKKIRGSLTNAPVNVAEARTSGPSISGPATLSNEGRRGPKRSIHHDLIENMKNSHIEDSSDTSGPDEDDAQDVEDANVETDHSRKIDARRTGKRAKEPPAKAASSKSNRPKAKRPKGTAAASSAQKHVAKTTSRRRSKTDIKTISSRSSLLGVEPSLAAEQIRGKTSAAHSPEDEDPDRSNLSGSVQSSSCADAEECTEVEEAAEAEASDRFAVSAAPLQVTLKAGRLTQLKDQVVEYTQKLATALAVPLTTIAQKGDTVIDKLNAEIEKTKVRLESVTLDPDDMPTVESFATNPGILALALADSMASLDSEPSSTRASIGAGFQPMLVEGLSSISFEGPGSPSNRMTIEARRIERNAVRRSRALQRAAERKNEAQKEEEEQSDDASEPPNPTQDATSNEGVESGNASASAVSAVATDTKDEPCTETLYVPVEPNPTMFIRKNTKKKTYATMPAELAPNLKADSSELVTNLLKIRDESRELEQHIQTISKVICGQVSASEVSLETFNQARPPDKEVVDLEFEAVKLKRKIRIMQRELNQKRNDWNKMDSFTQKLKQRGLAIPSAMKRQNTVGNDTRGVVGSIMAVQPEFDQSFRRNSKVGADVLALRATALNVASMKIRAVGGEAESPSDASNRKRITDVRRNSFTSGLLLGTRIGESPSSRFSNVTQQLVRQSGSISMGGTIATEGLSLTGLGIQGLRKAVGAVQAIDRMGKWSKQSDQRIHPQLVLTPQGIANNEETGQAFSPSIGQSRKNSVLNTRPFSSIKQAPLDTLKLHAHALLQIGNQVAKARANRRRQSGRVMGSLLRSRRSVFAEQLD